MPRAQDPTQSLLRWGIENAAPGSLAATAQEIKEGKRPDLNTDILKAMMGQSDAEKMRECLMVISGQWIDRDGNGEVKNNADITTADKYRAWEDLEMVTGLATFHTLAPMWLTCLAPLSLWKTWTTPMVSLLIRRGTHAWTEC